MKNLGVFLGPPQNGNEHENLPGNKTIVPKTMEHISRQAQEPTAPVAGKAMTLALLFPVISVAMGPFVGLPFLEKTEGKPIKFVY